MNEPIKHFYFVRMGNKQNDLKYFEKLLPTNVKTVIEPFAGTFAVIRNYYYEPKYKRVINDNDKDWYKLLLYIKNKPAYINKILKDLLKIKTKNQFNKIYIK